MNLFALNAAVYMSNKQQRGPPSDCSEHEEEGKAGTEHVAKEEGGLHEARHI